MRKLHDVIYGTLEFNPIVWRIIDTSKFQRLRHLKQLGLTYQVFPSCNHTRFEHSVGVCHLAIKWAKRLRDVSNIKLDDRTIQLIGVAGLLHDVGHGPFSHTFEKCLHEENIQWKHEDMSIKIVDAIFEEQEINDKEKEMIKHMIKGKVPKWDDRTYLYKIVSNSDNGIDVDKFDYLVRDSYYSGISIDFQPDRIIYNSIIIDNDIHFDRKIAYTLENMYRARYNLHRHLYTHKTSSSYEIFLLEILSKSDIFSNVNNVDYFLTLDDRILYILMEENKDIANKWNNRKHYKEILKQRNLISRNTLKRLKSLHLKDYIIKGLVYNFCKDNDDPLKHIKFHTKEKKVFINCDTVSLRSKNNEEVEVRVFEKKYNKKELEKILTIIGS